MVMAMRWRGRGKAAIVRAVRPLRRRPGLGMMRSLVETRPVFERHGGEKEVDDAVDEYFETLHNLSSLLLTNKTIRRTQQGSTEHGSLTINSR
jgi:hypothetical protein